MRKWIRFVRRKTPDGMPWQPSNRSLICSRHFVGNMPHFNPMHPAYVPTIRPKASPTERQLRDLARFNRLQARKKKAETPLQESQPVRNKSAPQHQLNPLDVLELEVRLGHGSSDAESGEVEVEDDVPAVPAPSDEPVNVKVEASVPHCPGVPSCDLVTGARTQVDLNGNGALSWRPVCFAGAATALESDAKMHSLTGLTRKQFSLLLDLLERPPPASDMLSPEDSLLLALMRLEGLNFHKLGTIFGMDFIDVSTTYYRVEVQLRNAIGAPDVHASLLPLREIKKLIKRYLERWT